MGYDPNVMALELHKKITVSDGTIVYNNDKWYWYHIYSVNIDHPGVEAAIKECVYDVVCAVEAQGYMTDNVIINNDYASFDIITDGIIE